MREVCENCWLWEYRQQDDGNMRYGKCGLALVGGDEEAYPASRMLLVLTGPKHARDVCYPELLTRWDFHCDDFSRAV